MRRIIYLLIGILVVASGIALAKLESGNDAGNKNIVKPITTDEMKAVLRKWEATPDGIATKNWEKSAEGKQILASAAKVMKHVKDSSEMEAVITSLSLPTGARLGYGLMVMINGDNYILSFGLENENEFKNLKTLKVNDVINIKSSFISYAPKYAYAIITAKSVVHNGSTLFKRTKNINGC
ncbi:MAG: hypothetical protein MUE72_05605 [Chitinophagaceae bacterium]|jgi:predicted small secreted protein|nr:hypothetical protein [Chitinophagaceae bacterium]